MRSWMIGSVAVVSFAPVLEVAAAEDVRPAPAGSPDRGLGSIPLPRNPDDARSESLRPAWNAGAQAEFVGPTAGVSAAVLGYDSGSWQAEVSIGLGIGTVPTEPLPVERTDIYTASVRLAYPLHRGVRADFSLLVAAGTILIDRSDAALEANGTAGVGARLRSFFTPNVALMGTLGFVAVFDADDAAYFIGARPLGSAAVVYFFR